jgi:predicted MPP superfamily phosphohydrolase
MSRSYKKTPIIKDHDSGKVGKKLANRKVRRYKEKIANGKAYKKVFNSWDIHDYISRYSFQEFKKDKEIYDKAYENGINRHPFWMTEKKWEKYYKRK